MIKNIVFYLLFMLIAFTMNAQENNTDFNTASAEADTPVLPVWISVGMGLRMIRTTPGTIDTRFTDDSIDRGFFDETTEVESSYQRAGLSLEMGATQDIGLSHRIFWDFSFGKQYAVLGGYSASWELPVAERVIVSPGFNVMYGSTRLKLGKMDRIGEYTQINDKVFFDSYLNVRLKQNLFAYGPRLDFSFLFPKQNGLTLSAAYDLGIAMSKPKLHFSASGDEDVEGGNSTAVVKLPDNRANVTFNDNELAKIPYKGGLRITLGYIWTPDW